MHARAGAKLRPNSPQPIPFLNVDMRLTENSAERANGDVAFPGYNLDVNDFSKSPHELDMAAASALDLAEGRGLSRPNLNLYHSNPRRALCTGRPRLRLPIHPDWLRLLIYLHLKQLPQKRRFMGSILP